MSYPLSNDRIWWCARHWLDQDHILSPVKPHSSPGKAPRLHSSTINRSPASAQQMSPVAQQSGSWCHKALLPALQPNCRNLQGQVNPVVLCFTHLQWHTLGCLHAMPGELIAQLCHSGPAAVAFEMRGLVACRIGKGDRYVASTRRHAFVWTSGDSSLILPSLPGHNTRLQTLQNIIPRYRSFSKAKATPAMVPVSPVFPDAHQAERAPHQHQPP